MKNYDETIESVFRRINEYEVAKKQKRNRMLKAALPLCCFCVAALVGVGMWQSGLFGAKPPVPVDGTPGQASTDQPSESAPAESSTAAPPELPILWAGDREAPSLDAAFGDWRGKRVSAALYDILDEDAPTVYRIAVQPVFEPDEQFVYEGKTLSEYALAVEEIRSQLERFGLLQKMGEELKYK